MKNAAIMRLPLGALAAAMNLINPEAVHCREQIRDWAFFYREKLNGRGYPFHIDAAGLSMDVRSIAPAGPIKRGRGMKLLGLDLGTTTLSAVVLDGDTGALLKTLNVPNGAYMTPRAPYERIQYADAIARRAEALVEALKEEYAIDAIGLDGQMHGIVYVNARGEAVSPLFTWQDGRGGERFGSGSYAGALYDRCSAHVATGYGMATHFWHTVNSCVPRGAAAICTIGDYVGMRLTGRAEPLMHVSNAASLGLFDERAGNWNFAAIERAGMGAGLLPRVTGGYELLGRDSGGAPVACGIGDNQASFIGALRDMEGTLLVNLGTGGQVSMLSGGASATEELELRPLTGDRSIIVGSALCGGRAYALLEGFLRSCAALAGYDCPDALYEEMNRAGLEHLRDASLPRVDPRFNGTRADPALRGSVCGIGTDNFDAPRLIAGTLLGMAGQMRGLYDAMLAAGASPARRLVGSGNAVRRNPALRRALEGAFGMKMRLSAHREEAALGAALFAMTAAGVAPSLEAAQRLIRYEGERP